MSPVSRVTLPAGALIGRYGPAEIVGVYGIKARSVEVTNCLPWSRKMELQWVNQAGRNQVLPFSLPAGQTATLQKLSPNTNYTLFVYMPVEGGPYSGSQQVQTRVKFVTLREGTAELTAAENSSGATPPAGSVTGTTGRAGVFETRGAAATAFARVLESSNNRYHIDLIARGRYGGGKVGVHDFRSAFPYGLDPQGQPYRFELSLRMMPREVAHNGDRINVVIYSYETREKEIVFFGSIVAINGRSVGIADPVLSRRG